MRCLTKKSPFFMSEMLSCKEITTDSFIEETLSNLNKLNQGEFRKELIVEQWKNFSGDLICEIECIATVSSGFYIRQFVKDIGKMFNINVVVTEIERISVATSSRKLAV